MPLRDTQIMAQRTHRPSGHSTYSPSDAVYFSPGMKGKKIELTTLIPRLRFWVVQVCNTNRRNFFRSRLKYKFHDEGKENRKQHE